MLWALRLQGFGYTLLIVYDFIKIVVLFRILVSLRQGFIVCNFFGAVQLLYDLRKLTVSLRKYCVQLLSILIPKGSMEKLNILILLKTYVSHDHRNGLVPHSLLNHTFVSLLQAQY